MEFEVVNENYTPDKGEEVSKEGLELKYLEPMSVDSLVEPDQETPLDSLPQPAPMTERPDNMSFGKAQAKER